jgi:hypothetical protein
MHARLVCSYSKSRANRSKSKERSMARTVLADVSGRAHMTKVEPAPRLTQVARSCAEAAPAARSGAAVLTSDDGVVAPS